jgi:Zn-dependent protease
VFVAALFAVARLGLVAEGNLALLQTLAMGIQLNLALALFNLVPVPPLDGSKVAAWTLPRALAERYESAVASFGPWLLLLLLIPVSRVLAPLNHFLTMFLIRLAL